MVNIDEKLKFDRANDKIGYFFLALFHHHAEGPVIHPQVRLQHGPGHEGEHGHGDQVHQQVHGINAADRSFLDLRFDLHHELHRVGPVRFAPYFFDEEVGIPVDLIHNK